ncbi:13638_t:CDS:2, partial [Dentiscutata erythropus]
LVVDWNRRGNMLVASLARNVKEELGRPEFTHFSEFHRSKREIYNSHNTGSCFGGDYVNDGDCYCEHSAYKELIKIVNTKLGSLSLEWKNMKYFENCQKS